MAAEKLCFKDYINCIDDKFLSKTRKKVNAKSHKKRVYGIGPGDGGAAAVGESVVSEMHNGVLPFASTPAILGVLQTNMKSRSWNGYANRDATEEDEEGPAKIEVARAVFNTMIGNPNVSRQDIIDAMMERAQVTNSTAVSYYERIAKEAGLTNQGRDEGGAGKAAGSGMVAGANAAMGGQGELEPEMDAEMGQMGDEEMMDDEEPVELQHTYPDNPNKQGIIRRVDGSHLVYKRQSEDGTFEELWIYNISKDLKNELSVRSKILAGTDIPPNRTKSPDRKQSYTLTTLGNAQYLHIKGLPN